MPYTGVMTARLKVSITVTLCVLGCLALADSRADSCVKAIESLKAPKFDTARQKDPAYQPQFMKEYAAYTTKRNDLILNLYKAAPTDPRTAQFMEDRWMQLRSGNLGDAAQYQAEVDADIEKILAGNPPDAIKEIAAYCKAALSVNYAGSTVPTDQIDAFIKAYPKSEKGADLLMSATYQSRPPKQVELYRKIASNYPKYKYIGLVKGALRQDDAVNKPFELKFTDAIGGKPVDLSTMKGKVVLIDFWATWCGPCVAEMPRVKELYAKYHAKGLEMVCVSLDEPVAKGGLTKLKEFVAKNDMPWPQYFQGNGWDSKFSSGWGIMSIPTMFVVDKSGKFFGRADARDSKFEETLQKLLGS